MKHIRKVHVYGVKNPFNKESYVTDKEDSGEPSHNQTRQYTPQIQSVLITQYPKVYYKDNNSFDLVNTRSESYEIMHWYYTVSDQNIEKMEQHIFNESPIPRKQTKVNEFEIKLIKKRKPNKDEILRVKYKYLHNEHRIEKEDYNLKTIKNCKGESEPNESKIESEMVDLRGGCVDINNNHTIQQKNWKGSNKGTENNGNMVRCGNVDCNKHNCVCKQPNKGVDKNDIKKTNIDINNKNLNQNENKKNNKNINNSHNNSQKIFNDNHGQNNAKKNSNVNNFHNNNNNSKSNYTPNNSNISTISNSNQNDKKSNSRNHSKEDKQCQVVHNDINDVIGINNKEYLPSQIKTEPNKISSTKSKSPIRTITHNNSNTNSNNIITIKKGKVTPLNKEKIEIKLKKSTYTSPQLFNNNILCVTRDYINKEIKPKELKRTCPCHRHLDSSNYTNYTNQQQQHQHQDQNQYQHQPKNVSIRLNYSQKKNHSQQHNYQINVKLPQNNTHSQFSSSINKIYSSNHIILDK